MRCGADGAGETYDLADSDLLAASLLLDSIIQNDVQENLGFVNIRERRYRARICAHRNREGRQ